MPDVQPDDVWVPHFAQQRDLAPHLLAHVEAADLVAVEDLDGHLVAGDVVLGNWLDTHIYKHTYILRNHQRSVRQIHLNGWQKVSKRQRAPVALSLNVRLTLPKEPMPSVLPRR